MKQENLESLSVDLMEAQNLAVFNPIHALERGADIIEHIFQCLYQNSPDQDCQTPVETLELECFLQELIDTHGDAVIDYIAIKFGIITSPAQGNRLFAMEAQDVAQRLLKQHENNPVGFRDALIQVLEEENKMSQELQSCDLETLEHYTRKELEELVYLSNNPGLHEFLQFVDDLDAVFQKRSYLFSYLEHRYAEFFKTPNLSPQFLAVQICLDYLTHREQYQLAIITEYEKLMKAVSPDPLSALMPRHGTAPSALQ